jgi:RsiW-degrading membrane proteinase PrsW (M82 family)
VLALTRWLAFAIVPPVLFAVLLYRTDRRREPAWLVALTFLFGALGAAAALAIERKAMQFTGLDTRVSMAGNTGALAFLFLLVAPVSEAAKVAACWPAFRSRHFDEPYDGIVYAGAAALGYAAVEVAFVLVRHPTGWIWVWRSMLGIPAHVFCACAWGYALGRAKQHKSPGPIFPTSWIAATAAHGLYTHFVFGRGEGALLMTFPMLLVMAGITALAIRDLRERGELAAPTHDGSRLSRLSVYVSAPASIAMMRAALRKSEEPIKLRWIVFGALVTLGAMFAFLGITIALAFFFHFDFSGVDERDVTTAAPVAILGVGLLSSFPVSGFLVARASSGSSLLEPALAAALALVVTLLLLGLAAADAVVFALAISPIAWAFSCAGAWVGRPAR